ncbi:MAG: hypothetical protein ABI416_16395 [Ginsengibacter sp.]
MNKLVRALIAGWGAKKIGGGCLSTIVVFLVIYYALGTCNSHPVQPAPQNHSSIKSIKTPAGKGSQVFNTGNLAGWEG